MKITVGRASAGAGTMVCTLVPAARVFFGYPEETELRAHPYIHEIVTEYVSQAEFREVVEKVTRIGCAIRHNRELPHAACTADTLRQGMFLKAGRIHPVDSDPGVV
jgi:hypothetical protein